MDNSIAGLQMKLVLLKNAVPMALEELNNASMDTFLESIAEALLNPPIVIDEWVHKLVTMDASQLDNLRAEACVEAGTTVHESLTTALGALNEIQTSMNGRKAAAEKELDEACTHLGLMLIATYLENVASEVEIH